MNLEFNFVTIKDKLKTGFTVEDTSNEYGTYNKNSGELTEKVPIYYVNRVDLFGNPNTAVNPGRSGTRPEELEDEDVNDICEILSNNI